MTELKLFLCELDGRCLIVENGIVTTTSAKVPLVNSPIGLDQLSIAWERDVKLFGLVRNETIPLKFVLDGKTILRSIIYSQSVERQIFLLILRFKPFIDATTFQHNRYEYLFKGQLDLVSMKDEDTQISVPIVEYGTSKYVKAFASTTYEIKIDTDPECVTIKMDGIALHQTCNYVIAASTQLDGSTHQVPITHTTDDGVAAAITGSSQTQGMSGTQYFLANNSEQTVNVVINGSIIFKNHLAGGSIDFQIQKVKLDGSQPMVVATDDSVDVSIINTYTLTYTNRSVTLESGWALFLYINPSSHFNSVDYLDSTLQASFTSTYHTTYIKGLKPFTVLQRLTEQIAGSKNWCKSQLLQDNSGIIITSGDAIRGLTGTSIKTSLNDFYEFCKVVFCAGIGIEQNYIVIEALDHFFTSPNKVDLGAGKNFSTTIATDILCNTIRIGYQADSSDNIDTELNGRYEFNNTYTFKTPYTADLPNKELTLICPYNAQPYTIEKMRLNLEGKVSTDNQRDNSVFLINADMSQQFVGGVPLQSGLFQYYQLQRAVYDPASTGLPEFATVFNIEFLTPKRCMMRWMKYFNSLFFQFPGQMLKFLSTEKNQYLKTVQGPLVIQENGDVEIGTERYFLPLYMDFENVVPTDLVDTMEGDPNTQFSVSWYDQPYSGILMKGAIAASSQASQSFKLLSSPDNDLKTLI